MTVKVVRSLATNNLLNKVMVPFVKVPWSGNVSSYHWELHQFQFDSIHSTSKTSSREATDGLTQKKAWFKSVNESTLRSKSTSSMIKMSRNYHEATGHFVVTAIFGPRYMSQIALFDWLRRGVWRGWEPANVNTAEHTLLKFFKQWTHSC